MSLDSLVLAEMQKKAIGKGVDLNDPIQFKVFAENLARVNLLIEGMIIQTVERYQCQGCGKPKESECTPCEEKRRAMEALGQQQIMPTPVDPPKYINPDEHY